MVGYPRAFLMLKPFYHKIICLSSLLAPCCAPFFVKRKPLAFFFSSFAGKLTSRGTPQAARCTASCKIPVLEHRETGICSCLLQSNPCEIFLCFAKAFGQPLKTTHRVVFLTLSFKSPLLSDVKQKRTSKHLSVISIGETGICEIA